MRAKLIVFVVGIAVGVAGMWLVQNRTAPPASAGKDDAAARLQAQLDATLQQNKKLAEEKGTLTAKLLNLKSASPKPVAAKEAAVGAPAFATMFGGGSDTNAQNTAFAEMIKAGIEQQVNGKVSALKLRLKLTPEQEQKLRELLQKQFGMGADFAAKMFEGKLTKEEMEKMRAEPVDVDGELKNVLMPEQFAEYEKYKVEERRNEAEMMANMELGQLSSSLQLTEQQKDQVFNILYQQAEKQPSPEDFMQSGLPADWKQAWQQQEEAKKEALREVLTPEQIKIYEQQLEAERKMMEAFIPGQGGDSATGAIIVSPSP